MTEVRNGLFLKIAVGVATTLIAMGVAAAIAVYAKVASIDTRVESIDGRVKRIESWIDRRDGPK